MWGVVSSDWCQVSMSGVRCLSVESNQVGGDDGCGDGDGDGCGEFMYLP